jgi:hypothetical protein
MWRFMSCDKFVKKITNRIESVEIMRKIESSKMPVFFLIKKEARRESSP